VTGRPQYRVPEKHLAVIADRSQSGDKSPHSKGPLVLSLAKAHQAMVAVRAVHVDVDFQEAAEDLDVCRGMRG
jgi:hypothetical protein